MPPSKKLNIAVLAGDGIGIDVTQAALPIFDALSIPVRLNEADIGWSCWQREGTPIPTRTWQLINAADTVLLGAITSKPQREAQQELAKELQQQKLNYVSPIISLRQNLDLYANVRPCFSLKDTNKPFDFCIIRENTEGLYAGFDYHPLPEPLLNLLAKHPHWQSIPADELSCALRLQSTAGLTRLFHYAFQYADTRQMKRVTFADKANVLRLSGSFARAIFETTANQYPHIQADILNIDAVGLWLVRRPEEFGVIVAENMFGDILSDVGAGVMGGLGFAPSANVGKNKCYFEPVHGSAPRIPPNKANPCAMFLTISMLLHHFGYAEQARLIRQSVHTVINKGRFVTYDLGGNASTRDMAQAIIEQCLPRSNNRKHKMEEQLHQLHAFNSTEIADALDACGVEGALLNIKPLAPGMRLIGPAYTVRYASNTQHNTTFKNAANYIDTVPAKSILVIDNEGRIDCTAWGAILTQMALHRDISGTLVHGAVRDVAFIRAANYPLFCSGIYMRSGKNRIHKVQEQGPLLINGVTINPGDIIFADDNGALVIPQHLLADILTKAENIKLTEQNITTAIKAGTSLEQARVDYRYDQPWLGAKKEVMKLTEYRFIDIHYHASPDLYERRWHALEAGQIYQKLHGAVFLTSHLGATTVQASLAQKLGLPVFPSLVLNHFAGGINYRTILHALNEYQPATAAKMLVHFPTITGRTFASKLSRQLIKPELSQYSQQGETLFNKQQKLRKNAIDILKMAHDYPIVLTTGHASAEEVYSLIDACITYNVPALLLNQPAHPLVKLNAAVLNELAKNEFVWIEQTALTYLLGHQDKEDLSAVLTTTPRVIYSSDLGQSNQMDIENWLDYSNALFADLALDAQRKTDLLAANAAKLLSLE